MFEIICRKVLLPTPPKISKAEHRKMFEARVKARDEMAIRERQQQEAFVNQFYSDPSNILYFNRTPNHPLYGLPPDQQLQILQSQPIEVQYQMVQGYNSQGKTALLPQWMPLYQNSISQKVDFAKEELVIDCTIILGLTFLTFALCVAHIFTVKYVSLHTVIMSFFFNITEVVEQYIDPNTGIPITVEQLQAMYQHQQQPEVMYTEDGQPIQQVWPQQQVRVSASWSLHLCQLK